MTVKIPPFRIRGQNGEHEISGLLCTFSNIMPPEYDIGLDFYCELLEEKSPEMFFWIQAKATEKFEEIWSKYIEKETIEVWLKQLSPVFLILYETSTGYFYWFSVEDHREEWGKKMLNENKSIEVAIDRKHPITRNCPKDEFIQKIKSDIILANANHGIPHMIGEGYVRSIPLLWLSREAEINIRHRIRLGLDYLIGDCTLKENWVWAYEFARLLTEFDRGHYDHFLVLARICRQIGRYAEARDNYNIAIGICRDDPNWNRRKDPEDPTIEEVIRGIEEELSELVAAQRAGLSITMKL